MVCIYMLVDLLTYLKDAEKRAHDIGYISTCSQFFFGNIADDEAGADDIGYWYSLNNTTSLWQR